MCVHMLSMHTFIYMCVYILHVEMHTNVPDLTRQMRGIIVIEFLSLSPLLESKFFRGKEPYRHVHLHILEPQESMLLMVYIR